MRGCAGRPHETCADAPPPSSYCATRPLPCSPPLPHLPAAAAATRTCGNSEPKRRPTRRPRRVAKLASTTSGTWPVWRPWPVIWPTCCGDVRRNAAVGPSGRCVTMRLRVGVRVGREGVGVGGRRLVRRTRRSVRHTAAEFPAALTRAQPHATTLDCAHSATRTRAAQRLFAPHAVPRASSCVSPAAPGQSPCCWSPTHSAAARAAAHDAVRTSPSLPPSSARPPRRLSPVGHLRLLRQHEQVREGAAGRPRRDLLQRELATLVEEAVGDRVQQLRDRLERLGGRRLWWANARAA